jgi:hypothetical protein
MAKRVLKKTDGAQTVRAVRFSVTIPPDGLMAVSPAPVFLLFLRTAVPKFAMVPVCVILPPEIEYVLVMVPSVVIAVVRVVITRTNGAAAHHYGCRHQH